MDLARREISRHDMSTRKAALLARRMQNPLIEWVRLEPVPLVNYLPPIAAPGTTPGPVADLLRLNTGVPPTDFDDANRLGLIEAVLPGVAEITAAIIELIEI